MMGEKEAETELSLAVACHSSIRDIDHIVDVVKKHGENSTICKINITRNSLKM